MYKIKYQPRIIFKVERTKGVLIACTYAIDMAIWLIDQSIPIALAIRNDIRHDSIRKMRDVVFLARRETDKTSDGWMAWMIN